MRVVGTGFYPAVLELPPISAEENLKLRVTLSPGGHTFYEIAAGPSMVDLRSTTSGAVIRNSNTKTGEPSVHPH